MYVAELLFALLFFSPCLIGALRRLFKIDLTVSRPLQSVAFLVCISRCVSLAPDLASGQSKDSQSRRDPDSGEGIHTASTSIQCERSTGPSLHPISVGSKSIYLTFTALHRSNHSLRTSALRKCFPCPGAAQVDDPSPCIADDNYRLDAPPGHYISTVGPVVLKRHSSRSSLPCGNNWIWYSDILMMLHCIELVGQVCMPA